jgi:hypothetical protein
VTALSTSEGTSSQVTRRNRPSPGKFRVIPACLAVQLQSGADGGRKDCPRVAQGMISAREPGRSRHWASTAGGRNVRACQMSIGSARKAADRPRDTRGGRPARDLGEAVRNRPLFAGPRGTRDSPLHSQNASEASLFDLGYGRYLVTTSLGVIRLPRRRLPRRESPRPSSRYRTPPIS